MFGELGVLVGVLGVFLCTLRKKVRRLEKGTPPPVVAVVTIMRYVQLYSLGIMFTLGKV